MTAAGEIIANLAWQHGVTYVRTRGDQFAEAVTRLSDDDVETDATENLLIALMRRGIIDDAALVRLLGEHLEETWTVEEPVGAKFAPTESTGVTKASLQELPRL